MERPRQYRVGTSSSTGWGRSTCCGRPKRR